MISSEQKEWLEHLSDTNTVTIIPYDLEAPKKFEAVKKKIQSLFSQNITIVHKGASSLGISGQGELDIYIPVEPNTFDDTINVLERELGKPGSNYPLKRARFNFFQQETKVELFVINKKDKGWVDSCLFEEYLRANPEELAAYKKLKEDAAGLSTRNYYTRKTEFINAILAKAKPSF